MGKKKIFKDGIYVLFRAERTIYERFKEICYEKLGISPSELFRAFMKSIVEGREGIIITQKPVQTAITVTREVEERQLQFDMSNFILSEQIRICVASLKAAINRKANPAHVRKLRDELLNLCGKLKKVDIESFQQVKEVLHEAHVYLNE